MNRPRTTLMVALLSSVLALGCRAEDAGSEASESSQGSTADADAESDAESGGAQLIDDYCECMLFRCHDHYHDLWGEDELVARTACLQVAAETEQVGSATLTGDNLECRMAHCLMSNGEDDATVCPAALGAAPCSSEG